MKKIIGIGLCLILLFSTLGCEQEANLTNSELEALQTEVTEKVSQNNYDNFASCYIDNSTKRVVVELITNTEEEQEWFRQNIVDSKYITFKEGGPYTTSKVDIDIDENRKLTEYVEYLTYDNRTIYLANNIKEFYVIDNEKMPLSKYITNANQSFDVSIEFVTNQLTHQGSFYDGGSSLYTDNEKNISVLVCHTLNQNQDIYIGDLSLEYSGDMCK